MNKFQLVAAAKMCPDCLMERVRIVELEPAVLLEGVWSCPTCGYIWTEKKYVCPLCGKVSNLPINPEQAFCTNDNCDVVMFNPSLPDGGLSQAVEMEDVTLQDGTRIFRPKERG